MIEAAALVTQIFEDRQRRRALLEIDGDVLIRMVRQSSEGQHYLYQTTKNAVPHDADVMSAQYDALRNRWLVMLAGGSLPLVSEGATTPILPSPETFVVNLAPLVDAVGAERALVDADGPFAVTLARERVAAVAARLVQELEGA